MLNAYISGTPELDPRLMQNLRRTVVQTNAATRLGTSDACCFFDIRSVSISYYSHVVKDLVLSTQWRKYPQHRQRLREALERSLSRFRTLSHVDLC